MYDRRQILRIIIQNLYFGIIPLTGDRRKGEINCLNQNKISISSPVVLKILMYVSNIELVIKSLPKNTRRKREGA